MLSNFREIFKKLGSNSSNPDPKETEEKDAEMSPKEGYLYSDYYLYIYMDIEGQQSVRDIAERLHKKLINEDFNDMQIVLAGKDIQKKLINMAAAPNMKIAGTFKIKISSSDYENLPEFTKSFQDNSKATEIVVKNLNSNGGSFEMRDLPSWFEDFKGYIHTFTFGGSREGLKQHKMQEIKEPETTKPVENVGQDMYVYLTINLKTVDNMKPKEIVEIIHGKLISENYDKNSCRVRMIASSAEDIKKIIGNVPTTEEIPVMLKIKFSNLSNKQLKKDSLQKPEVVKKIIAESLQVNNGEFTFLDLPHWLIKEGDTKLVYDLEPPKVPTASPQPF